jgi:hypothetical protein
MTELDFLATFIAIFLFWVIAMLVIAYFMNGRK